MTKTTLFAGGEGEVKQFDDAARLVRIGEHRVGDVEEDLDDGTHLLPVELQRIMPRPRVGLPVDVPRIVAGNVGAVVLEIE